jgi:hypothetical protein
VKCYIDNSVRLWSCIRNVNKHFWCRCPVFVYGLHRELHDQIQFIGQLPFRSRISNKEVSLKVFLTRIFQIPRPRDCRQISGITTATRTTLMAAWRCINDFSASSSANVRTSPETNIGDGIFKLKPTLINMVQQSSFCGKASEDVNAHLQHFMEIYNTFTIGGVTQDVVRLRLFPFSLLEKVKQWFYSNKEAMPTWEKCSNAFLTKIFPLGKTNAFQNKISGFQQLTDETIAEAWEHLQDYISTCPYHGMVEWFIIQSFNHGLIHSAWEHIDVAVRGSFFALSIERTRKLIEKMASNQS